MPRRRKSPEEEQADKLIRQWAARIAARDGVDVGVVLRRNGILDERMLDDIEGREVNFTDYQRYRQGRREQS